MIVRGSITPGRVLDFKFGRIAAIPGYAKSSRRLAPGLATHLRFVNNPLSGWIESADTCGISVPTIFSALCSPNLSSSDAAAVCPNLKDYVSAINDVLMPSLKCKTPPADVALFQASLEMFFAASMYEDRFDLYYSLAWLTYLHLGDPMVTLNLLDSAYNEAVRGYSESTAILPLGVNPFIDLEQNPAEPKYDFPVRDANINAWHAMRAMGAAEIGMKIALQCNLEDEASLRFSSFLTSSLFYSESARSMESDWLPNDFSEVALQHGWYLTASEVGDQFNIAFPNFDEHSVIGLVAQLSGIIEAKQLWGPRVVDRLLFIAKEHFTNLVSEVSDARRAKRLIMQMMESAMKSWSKTEGSAQFLANELYSFAETTLDEVASYDR